VTKRGGIAMAGLSPHPPIAVSEIGRGEEKKISKTLGSLRQLSQQFVEEDVDTLILITPHGPVFSDGVSIRCTEDLTGNLSQFGAPDVKVHFENDTDLVMAIKDESQAFSGFDTLLLHQRNLARYGIETELDHGTVVPLSFLKEGGLDSRLVVVNIGFLPYLELYQFGMAIDRAVRRLGRRVAILASGDLSHRLTDDAPNKFNPRGKEFDERLMSSLGEFDVEDVIFLPDDLLEDAGECGMRPIMILLGALDKYFVRPKTLSYEGPFGVGYGVMLFEIEGEGESRFPALQKRHFSILSEIKANEPFPVVLARKTVESYVRTGKVPELPSIDKIPSEFREKAGVFVSIHKQGMLRGCIGTTKGIRPDIVREIMENAVSAATEDPRFYPITPEELDYLDYSVDILSKAEPVDDIKNLNPKIYGVIVEKGHRQALLLPDLPGVDSVQEQLRVVKRKAGIDERETGVKVYRFSVTRYH
jgi:AmmeMemoRadiSam system protein A